METETEARAMPRSRRRRGLRGQRRRRRREGEVKRAVVAYVRWSRWRGHDREEAGNHLTLGERTLARWEVSWRRNRLAVQARGRPPDHVDAELRAAVMATLRELGPGIGVPKLRDLYPRAGKRELGELVQRYRHAYRKDRRVGLYALRWNRPGSVWAMDFAEPPTRIDGLYDQLLCVRDLPSEHLPWSLPILGKAVDTVLGSLNALVRWYGAPLVLKLDNDGVFVVKELQTWAERHGVLLLYSPAGCPSYNGAAECGIGGLKVRAHYASARHDRVGEWTCDDVETARCQMNALGRPRGIHGPSPADLWRTRQPITEEERIRFQREYREQHALECARRGVPLGVQSQHRERSSIDRHAIARALTRMGYLSMRRRRITLPVRRWKADKIS